jgi:uncharacterized membrane protein YadS
MATASQPASNRWSALLPGIIASVLVSAVAVAGGWVEERLVGRAIIEALVLAILIGMVVRTVRGRSPSTEPGVRFVAK